MSERQAECKLWFLQRGNILRLTPQCERTGVGLGSETCSHFSGQAKNVFERPRDVTHTCRRSQTARKLPPPEKRTETL